MWIVQSFNGFNYISLTSSNRFALTICQGTIVFLFLFINNRYPLNQLSTTDTIIYRLFNFYQKCIKHSYSKSQKCYVVVKYSLTNCCHIPKSFYFFAIFYVGYITPPETFFIVSRCVLKYQSLGRILIRSAIAGPYHNLWEEAEEEEEEAGLLDKTLIRSLLK